MTLCKPAPPLEVRDDRIAQDTTHRVGATLSPVPAHTLCQPLHWANLAQTTAYI